MMESRMNKYDTTSVKSRTAKNEKLYDEVLDMSIDYVNIDVDNAIDLTNKSGVGTRENYHKQKELSRIMPTHEEKVNLEPEEDHSEHKENRVYDINEILKLARDNKLFDDDKEKKRLINTEYNILTKLDVGQLDKESINKDDIKSLINDIYEKEKPVKVKKYSMKEEERLLNELFDDNANDELSEELKLKEELSKKILEDDLAQEDEKEVLTKEMESLPKEEQNIEFNEKADIEVGFDSLESEVKEGKGLLVAIIIVSVLILLTCCFFVYEYFFGL